jgi:Ca-activated chloride channel family protein
MELGFSRAARVAVLAQFCAAAFAFQQSSGGPIEIIPRAAPKPAAPVVRVDSSLVLIPVHVITAGGATVTGLKKEDFELFEDGVKQTITLFAQDDAPVSAGVLLDVSGSMRNKMAKASEAATEFFKLANREDEFFLVEFNSRARLAVPFTGDWPAIAARIAATKPAGMTAMLDGIHLAIAQMKHAHNPRKALVVVSDGGDNFSRRNLRELKETLIESDVQVYALGVFDHDYAVKHTPEERHGPSLLDQVALDTGGRTFPVVGVDRLPDIGVEIAREMRNQYVLGFSPAAEAADGKYHKVNLKLAAPNAESQLRAYYRQGYYAPGQ